MNDTLPRLLTKSDFAREASIGEDKVQELMDSGRLAVVEFGPRSRRIPSSELDRLEREAIASFISAATEGGDAA